MNNLLELLKQCCPNVDFENEKKIITNKRIDSIELVSMIFSIEEYYGVQIDVTEIEPEIFDSLESIENYVNGLKKGL